MEKIDVTKLENKAVLFEIEEKILEQLGVRKAKEMFLYFTVDKNSGEIEKVDSGRLYIISKNYEEYEKKSEEFKRLFLAYPIYVGRGLDLLEEERIIQVTVYPEGINSDMTVYNKNTDDLQYLRQKEDGSWEIEEA